LTQALLSLTSPLVVPLRRIMPPIGKLDTATLLVAFAVHYLALWVIVALHEMNAGIAVLALSSVLGLVSQAITLFVFAILIRIILSWFASGAYNPAVAILDALTEPVLRPFRRFIPPIGGFDISPIFPIILLSALNIIVRDYAAIVL
jgi:YggT family protein